MSHRERCHEHREGLRQSLAGIVCLALLAAAAPQAIAAQVDPRVLHRSIGLEPESLDPQLVKSAEAGAVVRDLYEGLVREGPAGEVLPGIAKEWMISPDGRVYRFTLRTDSHWCNGAPVTADEFVAGLRRNFDRALGPVNPNRWRLLEGAQEIIAGEAKPAALGITAVDPRTVEIRLREPKPTLLQMLYHPSAAPAPVNDAESTAGCPAGVVSNGAYALKKREAYDHVQLVRNEGYWDAPSVATGAVKYHVIEDVHAELQRFRAGELHVTNGVPPGRYDWLRATFSDEFRVAPYFATYFYGLQTAGPPFAENPDLRLALSYAIDRQQLVSAVTGNGEIPAYTWTPPGIEGYDPPGPPAFALPADERRALARERYAAAGYGGDKPLKLQVYYNSGSIHERIAIAIAGMWRDVLGVDTELVKIEWKVLLDRRRHGMMAVFRDGWAGDVLDPSGFLEAMLSDSENNHYGFDSARYDELVRKAARTTDAARRFALYREAEALLLAEQPLIPVYHYVSKHLVSSVIGGWEDNPLDHHLSRDLYFRE